MLTVIASLKVQDEGRAAFETAANELIAYVQANEPGTITYVCHRSKSDPTEYVFYEVYKDQAALDAHGTSPQMQKFFGAAGALLAGQPSIKTYEEIGAKR
jgi:quinol monooxygenase YgiN